MDVWVLVISTRQGEEIEVYASVEAAYGGLYDYVVEWWESEIDEAVSMPENEKEAIDLYFDEVETEWYTIQLCPIKEG
jgi:hypothetical protein